LLIGNSITKSLDKATITGGAGINVTNGPGSIALSLGGSGVTPGNYGNASTVPQLTVNEYGIISAATNVAIAISASQIVAGIIDPARISGNYSGITGVGTISSGTWQATIIGVPYGGTGLSSYTLGDMLYATGTTALSKLAIGANTYILASTILCWLYQRLARIENESSTCPTVSAASGIPIVRYLRVYAGS
jgi:hypothetical protein